MTTNTVHVNHPYGSNSVLPNYVFYLREQDGMIVFDDEYFGLENEQLVFGAEIYARKHAPEFPCQMHTFARDCIADPQWKTSQWLSDPSDEDGWTIYQDSTGERVNFCPNFKLYYPATPRFLQIVFTKVGMARGS